VRTFARLAIASCPARIAAAGICAPDASVMKVKALARVLGWGFVLWVLVSVATILLLRWVPPPATSVMWLEPGALRAVEYQWVPRGQIAVAAAYAAMAAEDQKFLSHQGFDFASIGDAIEAYRAGGALRGASTISQQVAKNLFLWNGRSFARKAIEAYLTIGLELLWPKQRILEMYLNIAEFGPGVFGVESAARRYFGKPAARLTASEAALLAAVLPSPKRLSVTRPNEQLRLRQADILAQMRLLEARGHYRDLAWTG
jgi:monofunctional biosynthetic peptidoglycan transglycosylase